MKNTLLTIRAALHKERPFNVCPARQRELPHDTAELLTGGQADGNASLDQGLNQGSRLYAVILCFFAKSFHMT